MTRALQALAHHPVEDQGREARARLGADALGQAVEHRRDLDLGFLHLEAALDVGQAPERWTISAGERSGTLVTSGSLPSIIGARRGARSSMSCVNSAEFRSTLMIVEIWAPAASWNSSALATESLGLRPWVEISGVLANKLAGQPFGELGVAKPLPARMDSSGCPPGKVMRGRSATLSTDGRPWSAAVTSRRMCG